MILGLEPPLPHRKGTLFINVYKTSLCMLLVTNFAPSQTHGRRVT